MSDAPHASGATAYSVSGESLSFYTGRAKFFLVPDESQGVSAEAFQSKIVNRPFQDKQSLVRLWFDYAVADCMAYLSEQCHDRRVDVPQNDVADIKIAIRTAVQFFSIAQVWGLLWKVVKEFAGLNHHRFYKDAKAGAPISERLVNHYQQARKQNKTLKSWNRVDFLPVGTLGDVFKERFGIDENTLGATVTEMFSEKRPTGREEIVVSIDAQVKELLALVLADGSGAEAIYDFAELVRNGDETTEALGKIAKIYAVSRTV